LELDQTNLVGVIEASNGRRALVRLPDGDFRKVARGDDVNGWRVNSIERAAMRLTRKGQNRTLLLVSR
jgi:Tfp pilus assembly protein PilP